MAKLQNVHLFSFLLFVFMGCQNNGVQTFPIQNLEDHAYPDNPDIGFKAVDYANLYFKSGKIKMGNEPFIIDITFFTLAGDTLGVNALNLTEFIPTIPHLVKGEEYLSYLAVVNQEWNRNQVRFEEGTFYSSDLKIKRIDIARNCLNAYLWEVIAYSNENGQSIPYAHGWFNFPKDTYATIFEEKNGVAFKKYQEALENWVDIENKPIDLNRLRNVTREVKLAFSDLSTEMYPLEGERRRKRKLVIYPKEFTSMRDLQSDSTTFATFSPPGIYSINEPRLTELGRFYYLEQVKLKQYTLAENEGRKEELELIFSHKYKNLKTHLLIGGIQLNELPKLPTQRVHEGWQKSMGIGNHTFYETYSQHLNYQSSSSAYFALLMDEKGNWLDSHKIGIDGPLMHWDDKEENLLHLWLLSFERHALVGHYAIKMHKEFSFKD